MVEQAARLATIEGLEGLSIGRLAEATGLPKSSVHALFGSKEELQLATINAARDSFIAEIGAQPGRVHDEVARIQLQWRDLLVAEARTAADQRELPEGTDAAQLAFELGVILAGTDLVSVLHDDLHAINRARTASCTRLTR